MYQAQVPLGGLPIHLVLVGNREYGRVAFVRVRPSATVFDTDQSGDIRAMFEQETFTIFEASEQGEFSYDTIYDYKNIPLMLRWLQQQNLQQPQ